MSSGYQRKPEVSGTSFGHSGVAGIEISGLMYGRIKAGKSQQFGRRSKAMNITNFAQDHSGFQIAYTGNGQDDRIHCKKNILYFGFNIIYLAVQ